MPARQKTRMPKYLRSAAVFCTLLLSEFAHGSTWADTAVPAAPHGKRTQLLLNQLATNADIGSGPIDNAYFMPLGTQVTAREPFEGRLTVTGSNTLRRKIDSPKTLPGMRFPAVSFAFITVEGALVPVTRGIIRPERGKKKWNIIVDPGRVWSEPGDQGWSRASFPFTLTRQRYGSAFNGIATFSYRAGQVSQLRFQAVQETSPFFKLDIWGSAKMDYDPSPVASRDRIAADYSAEVAARVDYHPWSELVASYGADLMAGFDGRQIRKDISLSALVIDGTAYRTECRNRFGPYPYCRYMRQGVYSMTKSMVAATALFRLAQKYGPDVLNQKIADYVALNARHDGWRDVTFAHALSMVTGIGNATPEKVDRYVDEDRSALMRDALNALTAEAKIRVAGRAGNYPWGPGEVFRYRTVDTMVLMAAMDAFLKSREGRGAWLWKMLTSEVFEPIGIHHLSALHTMEPDGSPGIPIGGFGLYPTLDDVIKIARLYRDEGRHGDKQLLYAPPIADVLHNRRTGWPTGRRTRDGAIHYLSSFWIWPHRSKTGCLAKVPAMAGLGGNYVLLMPNGMTAIRFADGPRSAETYDASPMRKIADSIRPLCDG